MAIHEPLKKRQEKGMTVAVGALTHEGFLIAADTEVNDGVNKTKQSKIMTMHRLIPAGDLSVVVTGAGDGAYLRILTERLVDVVESIEAKEMAFDKLEAAMGEAIHRFYSDHVYPMNDPSFDCPSLIIGCQYPIPFQGKSVHLSKLWRSSKSAMANAREFTAVGVGRSETINQIYRIWTQFDDLILTKNVIPLMIYVLTRVKDVVPNCGKDTFVCVSTDGKPKTVSHKYTKELEAYFDSDGQDLERNIGSYLFGDKKPLTEVSDSLRAAKEMIQKLQGKMWLT